MVDINYAVFKCSHRRSKHDNGISVHSGAYFLAILDISRPFDGFKISCTLVFPTKAYLASFLLFLKDIFELFPAGRAVVSVKKLINLNSCHKFTC